MSYLQTRPVILIGGAPCTGKSTLAANLSKHLGIPWGSTDQFREIIKFIADRSKAPHLFDATDHTAESYHAEYSAQDIIDSDFQQSLEIWPCIKKFIQTDWSWTEGFILEGVNIAPQIVAEDLSELKNVKALFVIDEDQARTAQTVRQRGIWDAADTYPDHVKESEIAWVDLAMKQIKQECFDYNLPCLSIEKTNADIEKALEILGYPITENYHPDKHGEHLRG